MGHLISQVYNFYEESTINLVFIQYLQIFIAEVPDDAFDELLDIKPRIKKLANQFNFCERAALTYNNPRRVSEFAM